MNTLWVQRLVLFFALHSLSPALGLGQEQKNSEPTAAGKRYAALIDQYEQEGGARSLARDFLDLAQTHPQDPVAFDALAWVVRKVRGRSDTSRALDELKKRHLKDERLAEACKRIAAARSTAAEPLLRAALENSPHASVRAQACFHLAELLDKEAEVLEQIKAEPELAPRVLQYYGKDYGRHLADLDAKHLEKARESIYASMKEQFSEVEVNGDKLAELAERRLFAIRRLSVGKPAPEIAGEDIFGETFKLSDYRGKVVLLTFWGHW